MRVIERGQQKYRLGPVTTVTTVTMVEYFYYY